MERSKPLVIAVRLVLLVLAMIGPPRAQAVPAFARKFGVSCAACHTSPPRLNEAGYRFRAAGFRWRDADESKEKEPFDILDYMSARIQFRYSADRSRTGLTPAGTRNEVKLQALEFYPFIGSVGKYFSADTKVTFTPGQAAVIENAYMKGSVGNDKRRFESRIGIFHPFDGYGASDNPATISRPFFQTSPANLNGSTFFTTWGFDQLGVEVGFDYQRTSVRAAFLNGLVLSERNGDFKASAAQGGGLTARSAAPTTHTPDFQLFVNHVLDPAGGGLSLHYYHGDLPLPNVGTGTFFHNNFDRLAAYGSYPLAKRLHLLAGAQRGTDHVATGKKFVSGGAFVEASVPVNELTAVGTRWDWFDPARSKQNNEVKGITVYVNAWFYEQFRIIAEYQHKITQRGLGSEQRDDSFQVRFIYIK